MAKDGKGRIIRGLADLGIYPKRDWYAPPRGARQDRFDVPLADEDGQLSEIDWLIVRYRDFRGKIVDFAIVQVRQVDDGEVRIAKVDCDRGVLHRHQYDMDGEDLFNHQPICEIPSGEAGQIVVNDRFPGALKLMQDEWEANLRRWQGE